MNRSTQLTLNACSNLEEGEKEYLRGQLLQLILEEDNQVNLSLICYVCYLPSWQQVQSRISQVPTCMAMQKQTHRGSYSSICMLQAVWHILVLILTCTCSCIFGLLFQHVPLKYKLS